MRRHKLAKIHHGWSKYWLYKRLTGVRGVCVGGGGNIVGFKGSDKIIKFILSSNYVNLL